ncbi:MAG: N-acetylglucosamine-6-phosphate deacetylase [Bacillus sp. (in: Bacteria)]|nr:N-acetylglucosamine-6-phosphate deacetylase [Bacillus sp. (in: firmicutes)]
MAKGLLLKNISIYTEAKQIISGSITIKEEIIHEIREDNHPSAPLGTDVQSIDGKGKLIAIPGFIDTHIHGTHGADVMDGTTDALETMALSLPAEGTTSFLATTLTQSSEKIEQALESATQFTNKPGKAELLGVHLEGPYICAKKAGAQPEQYITTPSTKQFFHWQNLSNQSINTITLAPEKDPDGLFIHELSTSGINISAGHTSAKYEEIQKATTHGVNQLTHLCNAMSGIHHRDVGVVGAAMLLKNLKSELIVDGEHVSPEMVEILFKTIGPERLMLITDSIRAKGLGAGTYDLGGQNVTVSGGTAKLDNGSLAGSILSMIDGVKNMVKFTDASLQDIIQMTSVNPAKQLKLFDRKGSISEGKDADILLIDENLNIHYTICRGKIAYQGDEFQEDDHESF